MALSVKCPTSAQVMISWYVGLNPALGSVLTAQRQESASDSGSSSLSLCSFPIHVLSLSLSKTNKHKKKKNKAIKGLWKKNIWKENFNVWSN